MTIYTTGAGTLPAVAERNRNSMMLQVGKRDTNPLFVFDGVHSGLYISKTTGMGFVIGAGRAAINGLTSADGTLTAVLTADEPGTFTENATAADRRDLVILRSYPGNPSETGVKVEVVAGVPGGTDWPATPAGAIPLYGVIIKAGMSAANGGWNRAWTTDLRQDIGVPQFEAYTPTFTGFQSLGTGAEREGRYRRDGDRVTVFARLRGGAGAVMGNTALNFSLPFPTEGYFVYSGIGSLHHPNVTGTAWSLRLLSVGSNAAIWAEKNDAPNRGALVHPGAEGYPFGEGTELFLSLEYYIKAL